MRNLHPTEAQDQAALFAWAGMCHTHPELKFLYAIPNGSYKSAAAAGLAKATGLKPGVPDTCLPISRGIYHACYVELKRRGGKKPTDDQKAWGQMLNDSGNFACWCIGWDAAREILLAYLSLPNPAIIPEMALPTNCHILRLDD